MFCKKVFLEIWQNSQENTCAWISIFKVAGLRPVTLLKRRLWHRRFPVNFVKFLWTLFFIEHPRWLLLKSFVVFCRANVNVFKIYLFWGKGKFDENKASDEILNNIMPQLHHVLEIYDLKHFNALSFVLYFVQKFNSRFEQISFAGLWALCF